MFLNVWSAFLKLNDYNYKMLIDFDLK